MKRMPSFPLSFMPRVLVGSAIAARGLFAPASADGAKPTPLAVDDPCQATAGNPEWIVPTTIHPANGLTFVNLTVKLGVHTIGPDRVLHRSYNGEPVGPVIRTRPGDELIVHLENKLPIEAIDIGPPRDMTPGPQPDPLNPHSVNFPHGFNTTNLHTHGLHVSPKEPADDVFLEFDPLLKPQGTYKFAIPPDHPSGTFWYHAHKHGSVGYQLASGMAGALIVEGGLDRYAGLKGVKEKIMVFQQVPYRMLPDQPGRIFPQDVYSEGKVEPELLFPPRKIPTLINGQSVPIIRMRPGEVQRFRMIHAGIETSLFVHLDGHDLYEIALDGIPLKEMRKQGFAKGGYVELEPGYRADVLAQASQTPGTYCLYNEVPVSQKAYAVKERAVSRKPLAIIIVEGDADTNGPDISSAKFAQDLGVWATDYLTNTVPKLKDIDSSKITGKRRLTFDAVGPKAFYIDDRTFDEGRTDQTINLNAVEEWTIVALHKSHPFHIHVNPFQVQEPYPDGSLKWVWRDTYFIREGKTATIRSRFLDFDGKTVLHCHNLDHEDLGMMQIIQIVNSAGGAASPATARGLSMLPRPAPAWTLEDTDGRPVHSADYKGRPLLFILHRGLDCLHCAEQIAALARTEPAFRALGVEIVAVSPLWPGRAAVRAAREKLGIRFPLLVDPALDVFGRYGCRGELPLHGTFLIDADGMVRWQSVGDRPVSDMNRLLERARLLTPPRVRPERPASTVSEGPTGPRPDC